MSSCSTLTNTGGSRLKKFLKKIVNKGRIVVSKGRKIVSKGRKLTRKKRKMDIEDFHHIVQQGLENLIIQ